MVVYRHLVFLLICLITIGSVSAANWYVDKYASGSNSGNSWANAWESFSSISWGSVNPGDTIYLSGGTNSKIYYEQLVVGASGASGNPITIKNSDDPGHNGRVIIDDSPDDRYGVFIAYRHYITLSGFEIRNNHFNINVRNEATSITIDSMTIYDWTYQGVKVGGNTFPEDIDGIIIQNSSLISSPDFGGDAIAFNKASNIVIRNNYIHIRNAQRENAHIDGILALACEGFMLYNNVIILDSNAQGQAYIIRCWADSPTEDFVVVYNNFFYQGGIWDSEQFEGWAGTSVVNLRWQSATGQVKPPTYVLHNTIIGNGPYVTAVVHEVPSTFVNNVVALFGNGTGVNQIGESNRWDSAMRGSSSGLQSENVRENLIWREWFVKNPFNLFIGPWSGNGNSEQSFEWDTWVNTLGGTGVNANPLFVIDYVPNEMTNQGGLNGELQANSPAINQGENIQALVESFGLPWTDINGNPRDSTPDIGAYQYGVISCPPPPPCGAPPPNGCQYTYETNENGCQVCGELVCTGPDLNGDGCIDLNEISAYVQLWLNGDVTLGDVSSAVNIWLQSC